MAKTPTITESDILADVIAPDEGNLTPDVAQSVLNWKFTDRAVARMNELADRNNKGAITTQERQELEKYLRVGSLINILQAIEWPDSFVVRYRDGTTERLLRGNGIHVTLPADDPDGQGGFSADIPKKHPQNQTHCMRAVGFHELDSILDDDGNVFFHCP